MLPNEILLIILERLLREDPVTLLGSVPGVCRRLRLLCSGVRGDVRLAGVAGWRRTHAEGALATIARLFRGTTGLEMRAVGGNGTRPVGLGGVLASCPRLRRLGLQLLEGEEGAVGAGFEWRYELLFALERRAGVAGAVPIEELTLGLGAQSDGARVLALALGKMEGLRKLTVEHGRLSRPDMEAIAALPALEELTLGQGVGGLGPWPSWLEAARKLCSGDATVEWATRMVALGGRVDFAFHGMSLLSHAAYRGNIEVVRFLLEKGADMDKATNNGTYPLLMACLEGHLEVVQLLADKGADIDRALNNSCTPLYIACWKGRLEVARLLLEKGADVNKATNDGATPLYIACKKGHLEVVGLLVERGADMDKAKNSGATPLFAACQEAHLEVVGLLAEKGADMDKALNDGCTPLFIACQNGHLGVVQFPAEKGPDMDKAMNNDRTPLLTACSKDHLDVARLLLAGGADPCTQMGESTVDPKYSGSTCIAIAAFFGHTELVQLVLAAGADPMVRTVHGLTALGAAISEGHDATAAILRAAGAHE